MGVARVLIADDQPYITQMLKIVLCKADFDVVVAVDGAEALNIFATEQPDVVILDLNMPIVPGWEVCRQIKAQSDTPVLIISGMPLTELRASQCAPDADDYLIKPFDIGVLLEHVQTLLMQSTPSV